MKLIYCLALSAFLLFSCGGDKDKGNTGMRSPGDNGDNTGHNDADHEGEVSESDQSGLSGAGAICLWKELSLRETAGADGKWLTSALLGEKMDYTGNSETLEEKGKEITYHQVRLGDGTQGWVRSEFVALNALSGTFTAKSKIYKRPDILTATDNEFDEMDFVAVLSEKDGWYEVKGKRPADKWFVSGYVKSENVSTEEVDVAFSVLYQKAMAKEDETEQQEALAALLEEGSLKQSVFAPQLKEQLEGMKGYMMLVEAGYDCQIAVLKMSEFSKNRDWKAHWDKLEKQYTPAVFEGMPEGQYTIIASADSLVAIKHVTFSKENNGQTIEVTSDEFK